jgi:signal peptidase I
MGMFPGRIFGSPPERGDVAVFKYPGDQGQGLNRTDYIKRIVGMPGDRIQVTNGVLHINGQRSSACASATM